MKTILIIAVIVATVGAAHFDYNFEPSSVESKEAGDRSSGLCYEINKVICSQDCKQMFLCVKDEGVWSPIMIDECGENMYCNGNQGKCTPNLSTCSPTSPPVYQLNCTATGLFPDPYDCTVYHSCSTIGQASKVSACTSGWSYDALTTECDHSVADGVCFPAGPIPECTTPGQSGPVPENTNIYYVCMQRQGVLAHELFKCAHGGHFLDGLCTPTGETTADPGTTTAAP